MSDRARGAENVLRCLLVLLVVAGSFVVLPTAGATSYDDDAVAAWGTDGTGLVRDITTIGSAVYVGGSFGGIRLDAGSPTVTQPYLAAFDEASGAHIATFTPALDGEVWALEPSPDGTMLYVGGAFRNVNGAAQTGLVALDPATGATIAQFAVTPNQDILDLAVDDQHLYLAGRFWNITGAPREKVARLDVATGAVDPTWAPSALGGTASAIAVDPTLERVYIGGFFSSVDNVAGSDFLAAVSRLDGSVLTSFDPDPAAEVYDLARTTTKLYAAIGGPGGRLEIYDTGTGLRRASWYGDGDIQSVGLAGDRVYVGGHHESVFGPTTQPWLNEVDSVTDAPNPAFAPDLTMQVGFGVWAIHPSASYLWVGGALDAASPVDAVGFARFPVSAVGPSDTTAPTTPTNLTVTRFSDVSVTLGWSASTDNSGLVGYIIERNGIPIASSATTEFVDTTVAPDTAYSYSVVAIDPAENLSGTSAPAEVTTLPPLTEIEPVPFGHTWSYLDDGTAPDPAWNTAAFDAVLWSSGAGELGVGDGDETTVIASRPVVYFRTDFALAPGTVVGDATLRIVRDDGAIAYANGTELARDNLPAGPVGHTTTAVQSVFGPLEDEVLEFPVDPGTFAVGDNTLAVSVHNASGSNDMSFDAQLVLRVGTLTCNGAPVTVDLNDPVPAAYTAGPDVVLGTDGPDVINSAGGDDTICGGGGDDTINGGPGDDTVLAGEGNDTVFGADGDDTVYGESGNDTIQGNAGLDTLSGGDHDDTLSGNDGNDTLYGGAGTDTLYGESGDDTIGGGEDADTVLGGLGNDTINGGGGADLISGNAGDDTISGGDADDTMYGTSGSDTISGDAGLDAILGGTGDDVINGGDGDDQLSGNEDDDTISGGPGNDSLYGVDGDDTLHGDAGNDTILAGNGTDAINGGVDNDLLSGNAGNDTVHGDAGSDIVYGVDGDDNLTGGDDDDLLLGGSGNDTIDGGAGNDQLSGEAGNDVLTGGTGIDTLFGQDGDDTLDTAGDGAIDGANGGPHVIGDTCIADPTDNTFNCEL